MGKFGVLHSNRNDEHHIFANSFVSKMYQLCSRWYGNKMPLFREVDLHVFIELWHLIPRRCDRRFLAFRFVYSSQAIKHCKSAESLPTATLGTLAAARRDTASANGRMSPGLSLHKTTFTTILKPKNYLNSLVHFLAYLFSCSTPPALLHLKCLT